MPLSHSTVSNYLVQSRVTNPTLTRQFLTQSGKSAMLPPPLPTGARHLRRPRFFPGISHPRSLRSSSLHLTSPAPILSTRRQHSRHTPGRDLTFFSFPYCRRSLALRSPFDRFETRPRPGWNLRIAKLTTTRQVHPSN